MESVAEGIWSIRAPLTVLGFIQLNTRMTIVRLQDGSLWIHSPVPFTEEYKQSLDALGEVRFIVAPSCFHHMFVLPWKEAYPEAQLCVAKGLPKKRKDLGEVTLLGEDEIWPDFAQQRIEGMPVLNEMLFFHRESQTLIATDFLFYMPQASGFTGFYAWLNGFKQRVTTPLLFRMAIKDQKKFRTSLQKIRAWSPKNISMCHHYIYKEGAEEALAGALDRLKVPQ